MLISSRVRSLICLEQSGPGTGFWPRVSKFVVKALAEHSGDSARRSGTKSNQVPRDSKLPLDGARNALSSVGLRSGGRSVVSRTCLDTRVQILSDWFHRASHRLCHFIVRCRWVMEPHANKFELRVNLYFGPVRHAIGQLRLQSRCRGLRGTSRLHRGHSELHDSDGSLHR